MVLWIDPNDCDPPHGLDLTSSHDREKVECLAQAFTEGGFNRNLPSLVGYPLQGRVQLLSGTHRHLAGILTETKLPVTLYLRSDVEEVWGTDGWSRVIEDVAVVELQNRLESIKDEREKAEED